MVIIEQEQLAGVPVLHVVKSEKQDARLPLIFFIHGFTSAKEHNLHFGYLLAEAGYRAVLPDALFHGERDKGLSERKLQLSFWDIVVRTITEIEEMKNDLVSRGLADPERIGLAGTSMGGIVTFGALAVYPWVRAAVALMGCPNYSAFFDEMIEEGKRRQIDIPLPPTLLALEKEKLARYDLSKQPEKLAGRPLFIWHGKADQVVPYAYTYEFYKQIKPLYEGNEDRLQFIADPHAGHKVTREAFLETVRWFRKHV